MSDRISAVQHFREQAGGQVPIMGWVEGALAEAADLRGVSTLLTDLYDRRNGCMNCWRSARRWRSPLLGRRSQQAPTSSAWGMPSPRRSRPRAYRQFALPYEQRIFAAVREAGAIPRLHICGNTSRILADMAESGAEIVDIDWMVDMAQAAEIFGDRAAVCGNFDPVAVMLNGTPAASGSGCDGEHGSRWPAQFQRGRLRDPGRNASRESASAGRRAPGMGFALTLALTREGEGDISDSQARIRRTSAASALPSFTCSLASRWMPSSLVETITSPASRRKRMARSRSPRNQREQAFVQRWNSWYDPDVLRGAKSLTRLSGCRRPGLL